MKMMTGYKGIGGQWESLAANRRRLERGRGLGEQLPGRTGIRKYENYFQHDNKRGRGLGEQGDLESGNLTKKEAEG